MHETTNFSPNMLMLGREATTPLDIMYEMPTEIKEIPAHQWVWILRERLEKAHAIVRDNVKGEMLRQKKYHDVKVSWSSFKPGDMVYVYFPVRKSGCSPKLTSFWRGPYKVENKLSDVLYTVACGFREKSTVIHCDRMRKSHAQTLRGEDNSDHEPENKGDLQIGDSSPHDDVHIEETEPFSSVAETGASGNCRPRRDRNAPKWLQDYEVDYSG